MTQWTSDAARPVTTRTQLSYGVGQLGAQVFRDTPAVLLPVFMTTVLAVPAWLSGFVVLVPKLWLIVCDPVMGSLSDGAKARFGRLPFLVGGALLTGLGFISLFWYSGFSSPLSAAATLGALFFAASTAFSAYSVPYLAIASELSSDPHERTRILTWRMAFSVIGVIFGIGLAQPAVQYLGGGAAAWRAMALLMGGVGLLSMLATPLGLARTLSPRPAAVAAPARDWSAALRAAARNRPFLALTGTHFLFSVAQACGYTVVAFVFIYGVRDIDLLLPFILVMSVGSLLGQPFWAALSRRIGKRMAFVIAASAWILVTVSWLTVRSGPVGLQHSLVLLRGFVIGISNTAFILLMLSMLTDSINGAGSGQRPIDEGLLSGIFSAFEKLAFAVGPLIAGFILSASGYQSSSSGIVAQSSAAITGMILIYSVLPAALAAAGLGIFSRYRPAAS